MDEIVEDDYYDCFEEEADDVSLASLDDSVPVVQKEDDPEHFEYTVLSSKGAEDLISTSVEAYCLKFGQKSRGTAKQILIQNRWMKDSVKKDKDSVVDGPVRKKLRDRKVSASDVEGSCSVCLSSGSSLIPNTCGHAFCSDCWDIYLDSQINEGKGYNIPCMDTDCSAFLTEEFVLQMVSSLTNRRKYQQRFFLDCVESHPNFRCCSTYNCGCIFYSEKPSSKRVDCPSCHACICFSCGSEYHLPCDCRTIHKWFKKASEDSQTMTYLSSFTKDCPKCDSSIEKNGGCNHLICRACSFEFCWICLGDWKTHGKEYYECNKFPSKSAEVKLDKILPGLKNEATGKASAGRIAVNKYLFYFTRWKNHEESLRLEETLMGKISDRVQTKVKNHEGSLIDWQFLLTTGILLLKCRRTLQYSYAFAYYMQDGSDRMLFEHLQADLELNIEDLSFALERSETVDVANLQALMRSAEFRRRALIRDAANLSVSQEVN